MFIDNLNSIYLRPTGTIFTDWTKIVENPHLNLDETVFFPSSGNIDNNYVEINKEDSDGERLVLGIEKPTELSNPQSLSIYTFLTHRKSGNEIFVPNPTTKSSVLGFSFALDNTNFLPEQLYTFPLFSGESIAVISDLNPGEWVSATWSLDSGIDRYTNPSIRIRTVRNESSINKTVKIHAIYASINNSSLFPLYMNANAASKSGEIPLSMGIASAALNNNIPLYIPSKSTNTGQLDLYTYSDLHNNIPIYMGAAYPSSILPLFTHSLGSNVNYIDASIWGSEPISITRDMWTSGQFRSRSDLNLYSWTETPWAGTWRDFYISGGTMKRADMPLSMIDNNVIDEIPLFLKASSSWIDFFNLMALGGKPRITGAPLYIRGDFHNSLPIYEFGVVKQSKQIPLYTNSFITDSTSYLPLTAKSIVVHDYNREYDTSLLLRTLRSGLNNISNILNRRTVTLNNTRLPPVESQMVFFAQYSSGNQFQGGLAYTTSEINNGTYLYKPYSRFSVPQEDLLLKHIQTFDTGNILDAYNIVNNIYNVYYPDFMNVIRSHSSGELVYKAGPYGVMASGKQTYLYTEYWNPALPFSIYEKIEQALYNQLQGLESQYAGMTRPYFEMYLHVNDPFKHSDSLPLYTKTSRTGSGNIGEYDSNFKLYTYAAAPSSNRSLHTSLLGPSKLSINDNLLISIYNTAPVITDQIPLTINNSYRIATTGVSLYTLNKRDVELDPFDPLYFEIEDGGVPLGQGRNLFMKAGDGGTMPFYLKTPNHSGTNNIPIYVGSFNQSQSGVNLHTVGRDTDNRNFKLYTHGF